VDLPFYILPVLWVLCVFVGIVLLLFARFRATAARIILGSTCGLLGSFLLSIALPAATVLALKLLRVSSFDSLMGVAFLAGLPGGAILGVLAGIALARRFNRRMGW
jgi:hypothetical protein